MGSPIVLKTEALCKQFKVGFWGRPVTALERLDLEVHTGEIFGFLGPNGAGKTTTLKILMGLIYPTSGKAWILGHKVGEVAMKQQVGFLPALPQEPFGGVYLFDSNTGMIASSTHPERLRVKRTGPPQMNQSPFQQGETVRRQQ